MQLAVNTMVGLVAALHVYFLVLEMFLWDKPRGRRIFGTTQEFATASKGLAANQGLYNGFLVAGLIWGMLLGPAGKPTLLFFLGCVVLAGLFGGVTVNRRILYVQALPAAISISLVLLS